MRRLATALALALACVIAACDASTARDATPTSAATAPTAAPGGEDARVTRVIDGDTIEVELGGRKVSVRYIGVNTPETVDPRRGKECFGQQASDYNKQLVSGKRVRLERDVRDTDDFGRLLRYVYLDGAMVNERLVRDGYAHAATYPPDVKYRERLAEAEREAREARRGLWASCATPSATAARGATAVPPPVTSGAATCASGCETPPSGCAIKGNIDAEGVRIYHVPGGEFYDQTVITPGRGERWFCTEGEATSNGWRRSLQ